MAKSSPASRAKFYVVPRATHFTILAPMNRLIAGKILRDTGPETNLAFTTEELAKLLP